MRSISKSLPVARKAAALASIAARQAKPALRPAAMSGLGSGQQFWIVEQAQMGRGDAAAACRQRGEAGGDLGARQVERLALFG